MINLNQRVKFKMHRGVTLIELLIALVISGILIAILFRTFIGQQKTYSVQEQVVDIQQNMRVAINKMMKEIRMAGFGNVFMVLPVTFGTRTFNHVLNPDIPVTGSLTIVSAIEEAATIKGILTRNQMIVSRLKNDQGNLLFDTGNRRFISIGGLESHTISVINVEDKKITLMGSFIHNHTAGTPIFGIRAISYQVVNIGGALTLRRDENIGGGRQTLAENIENIQFEYFDSNGKPTGTPSNIRMVKVTITAKTNMPDPEFRKGDGYRRREICSHIYLRNMEQIP